MAKVTYTNGIITGDKEEIVKESNKLLSDLYSGLSKSDKAKLEPYEDIIQLKAQFWSNETMKNLDPQVRKAIEYAFPEEHYAGEHYFEAWPIRDILLQACQIGFELGSRLSETNAYQEKK